MTLYDEFCLDRYAYAAVGLCWLAAALSIVPRVGAQDLTAGSGVADIGAFVSISINIESAPNMVDAFGFDIFFDPAALAYAGTFVEGELAQPFMFFSVTEPAQGQLRVAAFAIDGGIEAGTSGLLVAVDFEVLACPAEGAAIAIGALVDDVAGWEVSPGTVDCPMAMLSVSDTELRLASAAGMSALRVRNAGNGPLEWDAFVASGADWLAVAPESGQDEGELTVTFAANTTGAVREGAIRVASARSTPGFVDVAVVQSADVLSDAGDLVIGNVAGNVGDFVIVPIAIEAAPTEASAFGIDFAYDVSLLRYTGNFTAGDLVEGFTLFAINEPDPGRLRLGAVAIETPISLGESGILATIAFEILACDEDPAELIVAALIDHVETWETVPGSVECGAPVLIVSSTSVRVSAAAGDASVTITNAGEEPLEWTADVILGSWLSVMPPSGSGDGTLTIQFSANNGSQSRGGEILIASNAVNPDSVIVQVIQAAPANPGDGTGCAAGVADGAGRGAYNALAIALALAVARRSRRNSLQCAFIDRRNETNRE